MEPMLFHLEWDVAVEVVFTIIVLAFFTERALSIVFEHRWYDTRLGGRGWSELIAFAVSVLVVRYCQFDALAILMQNESNAWTGYLVTAAIVAGGSKASIKLFHDLLDVRSSYERRKSELMKEGVSRDAASELAASETGRTAKGSGKITVAETVVVEEVRVEQPK